MSDDEILTASYTNPNFFQTFPTYPNSGATSEDHMDSLSEGNHHHDDGIQAHSGADNATEVTDVSQEEEVGDVVMGRDEDSIIDGGDSIVDGGDSIIDGGDSIVNGGDSILDGIGATSLDDGSIEGDMTSIASMTSTTLADGATMYTENGNNNTRSNSNNHNNKPSNTDKTLRSGLKGKQQYGGWNSQDHEVFAKIFRRAVTSGMLRKPLLEALRTQLPHLKGVFSLQPLSTFI